MEYQIYYSKFYRMSIIFLNLLNFLLQRISITRKGKKNTKKELRGRHEIFLATAHDNMVYEVTTKHNCTLA